MKKYIVEHEPVSNQSGYYIVVVEGETHLNRTKIKSDIQYYTFEAGYDYNHPIEVAQQNAKAIANGLNQLEEIKNQQKRRIVNHKLFEL